MEIEKGLTYFKLTSTNPWRTLSSNHQMESYYGFYPKHKKSKIRTESTFDNYIRSIDKYLFQMKKIIEDNNSITKKSNFHSNKEQLNPLNKEDNKQFNKNQNKTDKHFLQNFFHNPLPNNVICIAIGDIEGQHHKIQYIKSLIDSNPPIPFIFLGDLFDDISYSSKSFQDSLHTLESLQEFFVHHPLTSPQDSFCSIFFGSTSFQQVSTRRVYFIAGNSEVDCLHDISTGEFHVIDNEYVFGKGKYQKRFTYSQLQLLYDYFLSCFGSILYKIKKGSVLFRHARAGFRNKYYDVNRYIEQCTEWKQCENDIIVCGHQHNFGKLESDSFMIDICGDKSDCRMSLITCENGIMNANVVVNVFQEFPKLYMTSDGYISNVKKNEKENEINDKNENETDEKPQKDTIVNKNDEK